MPVFFRNLSVTQQTQVIA